MVELSTEAYGASVTGVVLSELLRFLNIQLTPPTFDALHFLIRKLAHLTEYAIFGLLLYHSFDPRHPESWNARSAFGALLVAGLFSLTDEYHQSFVPGRKPSLADCGFDTAGALLALVLLYALRRRRASSKTATRYR
jgi:VanZ family protein